MIKLSLRAFLSALGVFVYIVLISLVMSNGEKIFAKEDNFLSPIAFLLLFVFSATITGSLVLGQPLMLYLENRKKEAIKMFFSVIGWLFLFTVTVFLFLAFVRF